MYKPENQCLRLPMISNYFSSLFYSLKLLKYLNPFVIWYHDLMIATNVVSFFVYILDFFSFIDLWTFFRTESDFSLGQSGAGTGRVSTFSERMAETFPITLICKWNVHIWALTVVNTHRLRLYIHLQQQLVLSHFYVCPFLGKLSDCFGFYYCKLCDCINGCELLCAQIDVWNDVCCVGWTCGLWMCVLIGNTD